MASNSTLSDSLNSVSPKQVATAAMEVADKLQNYPVAVQLAAVGYCFRSYLEVTGQHAGNVLETVNNIRSEQDSVKPEFRAVEYYLKSLV